MPRCQANIYSIIIFGCINTKGVIVILRGIDIGVIIFLTDSYWSETEREWYWINEQLATEKQTKRSILNYWKGKKERWQRKATHLFSSPFCSWDIRDCLSCLNIILKANTKDFCCLLWLKKFKFKEDIRLNVIKRKLIRRAVFLNDSFVANCFRVTNCFFYIRHSLE